MIKYIFDVDGVLCDTGQLIDDEFSEYFKWWSKDKTYYLVTGSHKEKTIEQIGRAIPDHQEIGFHCIGNAIYPPAGGEVLINEFEFTEEEMNHFYNFWSRSIYDQKPEFDNVIEKRQGSYNFSLATRSRDRELRSHYMRHDKLYTERENFIIQLNNNFPRLEAYAGGSVSIDICLRGANKGQILELIDTGEDTIVFFCDQYGKYGIDTPLVTKLEWLPDNRGKTYKIDNGYKETWEILKTL
jgi:hydroxymethylpyrimidine pyrophosphatase-like HAD family hydrolase